MRKEKEIKNKIEELTMNFINQPEGIHNTSKTGLRTLQITLRTLKWVLGQREKL